MRFQASALSLVAVLVAGCDSPEPRVVAQSRIPLSECRVPGHQGRALCGTFDVWENPDAKAGRQISLAVTVLPARTRADRAEDPVFYLAGGPGASAIDVAGQIARELEAVSRTRDLVFVDARGTGRSGALACAPIPDAAPLQRYFDEFLDESSVRACLEAQTADVRYYTEPLVASDLDAVRTTLGYDRINLYGSSGGTRVALLYLRRYEPHVRAIALHGVHPTDGRMPLAYARGLETAVRSVISRCAADRRCSKAHPDLAGAWDRLQQRFADGAIEADLHHPHTGQRERVRITRGVFAEGMRHLLYDVRAPDLPSIIRAAGAGDLDPFARRHVERTRAVQAAIARGMFLSSTCAQDVRFISEEDISRETAGTFLGDYRVRRQQAACAIWPSGVGVDDDFVQPVRSEVPALLVSGDADVATPATLADRVAHDLPNALHVLFSNQGHALADPRCASRLISAFITAGTAAGLNLDCLAGNAPVLPGSR